MSMEPNVFITKDDDGNLVIDDQSVWRARTTKTVVLMSWNIVELHTETNGDTTHFVGSDSFDNTGRISTNIQSLDIKPQTHVDLQGREHLIEGIGYTLSGTEYLLVGDPTPDLRADAAYLFNSVFGSTVKEGRAKIRYV